jgi:hypothetical protein
MARCRLFAWEVDAVALPRKYRYERAVQRNGLAGTDVLAPNCQAGKDLTRLLY